MKGLPLRTHVARAQGPKRLALIRLVTFAVLALGLVACSPGESEDSVTLEGTSDLGVEPFSDQVADSEVAEFSRDIAAERLEPDVFEVDESTGTQVVAASTPGLYGGSNQDTVCDTAALVEFLAGDPQKAEAWGEVLGIEPEGVADAVASYSRVVLTSDTLVTNHGFADGQAVPRQSVLQAGTSVLVDAWGVPVVRCACGNPLLPPASVDLNEVELTGTAWDDFSASYTVRVTAAASELSEITVVDIGSGELVERPIGSVTAGVYIASAAPDFGYDVGSDSGIYVSEDGTQWSSVLSDIPLTDVATGDGLAVAVGTSDSGDGHIYTSVDGTSWDGPVMVEDALVSVAYGDGRWLAVGGTGFDQVTDGVGRAVTYESADGATWERASIVDPQVLGQSTGPLDYVSVSFMSVAYGGGQWIAIGRECEYRFCEEWQYSSSDGSQWSPQALDDRIVAIDIAFDGSTWGWVGGERSPGEPASQADIDKPIGAAGSSADGTGWTLEPTSPNRVVLRGVNPTADGWLAVQAPIHGSSPVPSVGEFYTSTDLINWELVGTIVPGATSVARLG